MESWKPPMEGEEPEDGETNGEGKVRRRFQVVCKNKGGGGNTLLRLIQIHPNPR